VCGGFGLSEPRRKLIVTGFGPISTIEAASRSHFKPVYISHKSKIDLVCGPAIRPDTPARRNLAASNDFTIRSLSAR
jgi:hypothetical protein